MKILFCLLLWMFFMAFGLATAFATKIQMVPLF